MYLQEKHSLFCPLMDNLLIYPHISFSEIESIMVIRLTWDKNTCLYCDGAVKICMFTSTTIHSNADNALKLNQLRQSALFPRSELCLSPQHRQDHTWKPHMPLWLTTKKTKIQREWTRMRGTQINRMTQWISKGFIHMCVQLCSKAWRNWKHPWRPQTP